MTKYSICITHFNNAPTLEKSLDSILGQIDDRFEVVLVDSESDDGSEKILQKYERDGKIKLLEQKCNRGRGRQIAFENSSGDYIISNMDMDDIAKPRLGELLDKYHRLCDGNLLWARSRDPNNFWGGENITIAPRKLIQDLGGWKDLQLEEDRELASRAAKLGRYRWTFFNMFYSTNPHEERRTFWGRIKFRYASYRDRMRAGRKVKNPPGHGHLARTLIIAFVRLTLPLHVSHKSSETTKNFYPYSPSDFVDFGEQIDKSNEKSNV